MVLFPPPFFFVFDISNLLSYIQNNFSYELARPIMGTIFLVIIIMLKNRKDLLFLTGCGKALPALSWTHNVSVDLKYDVLCL